MHIVGRPCATPNAVVTKNNTCLLLGTTNLNFLPSDEDASDEVVVVLKRADLNVNVNTHSWGQLKSRFPKLHKWLASYCRCYDHLTKIETCDSNDCAIFSGLGHKARTPISTKLSLGRQTTWK